MKKNNSERSEQRGNQNYLDFIKKNHKIVEELKGLNQISKRTDDLLKKTPSSKFQNKATIESDIYDFSTKQSSNQPNTHSKNKFSSLNDIVFSSNAKFKIPDDLPIHTRKQSSYRILYPEKSKAQSPQKNNRKKIQFQQIKSDEIDISHLAKLPKLYQKSNAEIIQKSESLEPRHVKKKKTQQSEQRFQKLSKYAPISLDSTKKIEVNPKLHKMESVKLQVAVQQEKMVRTFYDYEKFMELKTKVTELVPTFKPVQSKKKDKYEILQLNSELDTKLDKFLETSKMKRFSRLQERSKRDRSELSRQISIEGKKEELQVRRRKQDQKRKQQKKKLQKRSSEDDGQKKKTITILSMKKKQPALIFKSSPEQQTIYSRKIASFRQFLFLVNFAHRIYDPLILHDDSEKYKVDNKYKYYIGKGNNRLLIQSLLKRRFWWTQVDEPKQANFVWTQLKINSYYQFEKKNYLQSKYDKLDDDYIEKKVKLLHTKNSKKKIDQKQTKFSGILRGNIPEGSQKIFTKADTYHFEKMKNTAEHPQKLAKFSYRLKYLPKDFLKMREGPNSECRIHNHFLHNYHMGNKKALFYNLNQYYTLLKKDVFKIIPLTFHIKHGLSDPEFHKFLKEFKKIKAMIENGWENKLKNIWIVKPGQLSNRGKGITVIDQTYQVTHLLKTDQKHENGTKKTYIVQKYIEKPLLYKGRKFDIRHFMMISRLHGRLRAYWFSEGYIRTSSFQYDIDEVGDELIHLTNDAVQKQVPEYGKYEQGNKLSYAQFQRYIDNIYPEKKYSFAESTYLKMKQIGTDAIKASYLSLDPDELQHNFQIFGLDFMIDTNFNVWLIQINTNPCLELSSTLLSRIIPTFLQNTFRLTLDPIFPPTAHYMNTLKYLTPDNPMDRLQFELIFDESRDGKEVQKLFMDIQKQNYDGLDEEDETFQNDGNEFQLNGDIE